MTPYNYAKKSYTEGRSPAMNAMNVADRFLICDRDWNILNTKISFATKEAALSEISKVLNKTRKFIV